MPPVILPNMSAPSYDTQRNGRAPDKLECRGCGVVCERVVFPVRCLRTSCRYVYAFEEWGVTFFGCLQKVFCAELDLAPFADNPRRDVYGALKVARSPLSECHVEIAEAYGFRYSWQECRCPLFRQSPADYAPDAIRRLVDRPSVPRD